MITLNEFQQIDQEVQAAVTQILDYIKNNCREHNYILLLAEGEYKELSKNTYLNLNPFVIDNAIDKRKDNSRIHFLVKFLETYYSFPSGTTQINDDEYRMNLEMMVYTHTWEAESYLKKLYRLAELINNDNYAWEVNVPEMGKHDFIRNEIRNVLKSKNLALADIITQGFHTSLRNAFAHSQYSFNKSHNEIELHTYKGDPSWDIEFISYDDWTKRFVYTFFLNYHLMNFIHIRRMNLINDHNANSFLIIHPITKSSFRVNRIWYDQQRDAFSFYPFK